MYLCILGLLIKGCVASLIVAYIGATILTIPSGVMHKLKQQG